MTGSNAATSITTLTLHSEYNYTNPNIPNLTMPSYNIVAAFINLKVSLGIEMALQNFNESNMKKLAGVKARFLNTMYFKMHTHLHACTHTNTHTPV
jgi:hypothetical protein